MRTHIKHRLSSSTIAASGALDGALELFDYAGMSARERSNSRGKVRGVGLSSYVEACGIAPSAAVGALGGGVGLWGLHKSDLIRPVMYCC